MDPVARSAFGKKDHNSPKPGAGRGGKKGPRSGPTMGASNSAGDRYMKPAKRMKQAKTTPPPKIAGKSTGSKQTAGHAMGGLFDGVTPKKPEPDNFSPKRSDVRPGGKVQSKVGKRLAGVKL